VATLLNAFDHMVYDGVKVALDLWETYIYSILLDILKILNLS